MKTNPDFINSTIEELLESSKYSQILDFLYTPDEIERGQSHAARCLKRIKRNIVLDSIL